MLHDAVNRELKQATFLSTRTPTGSKSRRYKGKIVYLVLSSIKRNIKVNEQGVFSFSITCLVLQIFTVLKHANISCDVTHNKFQIDYGKPQIFSKL